MIEKNNFKVKNYRLVIADSSDSYVAAEVEIEGLKLPPPSKRITLHQSGLMIASAKILFERKKIAYEIEPQRINHLKSFEQVRLHTNEVLYPGPYKLKLDFSSRLPKSEYTKLAKLSPNELRKLPLRKYFPAIDELEGKQAAEFEINYQDEAN